MLLCATEKIICHPLKPSTSAQVHNCPNCECWMLDQLNGLVQPVPRNIRDLHSLLPEVSIIIVFYNEEPANLLGTLYSIWNMTSVSLIKEIILVDDFSDSLDAASLISKHKKVSSESTVHVT